MAGRNGLGIAAGVCCLLPLLVAADEPEPPKLAAGLERMEALTEKGEHEEALRIGEALLRPDPFSSWRRDLELEGSRVIAPTLEVVDPALAWFGLRGRGPVELAAVHYARGVVQLAAEDQEAARLEFESASASAGAGELRLAASYNLGTTVLTLGEAAYQEIPEVAAAAGGGGAAPPGMPPPGAMPPGTAIPGAPPAEEEQEDPLEKARRIYLEAKDLLVDRLRLDWRDADTRANVELVMRRLRQLDEIERQREEQEQEQQDQEQEQDEPQEDEQQENGDPQDQEDQQDSEQEGDREQQENSEQDPSEEPPEGEEPQGQPQERYLTKEEVQRLLDMLKEYEEKGEKALEQRRQGRQRRTERDW